MDKKDGNLGINFCGLGGDDHPKGAIISTIHWRVADSHAVSVREKGSGPRLSLRVVSSFVVVRLSWYFSFRGLQGSSSMLVVVVAVVNCLG
jgi:hypothetical protein